MEDGFDSSIGEALVAGIMPLDQVVCPSALDGFCECSIGVTIMEDEDAAVSCTQNTPVKLARVPLQATKKRQPSPTNWVVAHSTLTWHPTPEGVGGGTQRMKQ